MREVKAEGKYVIFDSRNLAGNKIFKARPSKKPLKQFKLSIWKEKTGWSLMPTFPLLPTYGKWMYFNIDLTWTALI